MLKKYSYLALGLMSGTSLDGVDLCTSRFENKYGIWSFKVQFAWTVPYPDDLKVRLHECIDFSPEKLKLLDNELGEFYSTIINDFIERTELKPELIASHGHTVFHRPEKGLTLQIGNGEIIARNTGITVVNDFRSHDVSLGGHGAPLVPIGDRDLFSEYDLCLNLGGFANISYEDQINKLRMACDLAPCNMALNFLSEQLGQPYDSNGLLARGGDVDSALLIALNSLEYYQQKPPKSLGKEWFRDEFLPLLHESKTNIFDKLATCTAHIAVQIGNFIEEHREKDSILLVTGGGTYNTHLLEQIHKLTDVTLLIPNENIIDYKEALIFSYLGILRVRNEINVLSSVTGASEDSSSGIIHKYNK